MRDGASPVVASTLPAPEVRGPLSATASVRPAARLSAARRETVRRLLTVQQAAMLAGVSASTVRSWLDYGRLKPIRLPAARPGRDSRIVRVDLAELEALIDASRAA